VADARIEALLAVERVVARSPIENVTMDATDQTIIPAFVVESRSQLVTVLGPALYPVREVSAADPPDVLREQADIPRGQPDRPARTRPDVLPVGGAAQIYNVSPALRLD